MTLNEALNLLETEGFLVESPKNLENIKKSPNMWDEFKTNFDLNQKLKEDFSMGVSGPMGLDQGIPHGGDGKGCVAKHMGLYQRSPFGVNPFYNGVPDAHHPNYWLKQIPKKRKKRKRRKLHENTINDTILKFKKLCLSLYLKVFGKIDTKLNNSSIDDLSNNFNTAFDGDNLMPDRASALGRVARRLIKQFNEDEETDNFKELINAYKTELKLNKHLSW